MGKPLRDEQTSSDTSRAAQPRYLYGSDRPGADGRAAFGSVSGASTRG